jgi:hypothetical protein
MGRRGSQLAHSFRQTGGSASANADPASRPHVQSVPLGVGEFWLGRLWVPGDTMLLAAFREAGWLDEEATR